MYAHVPCVCVWVFEFLESQGHLETSSHGGSTERKLNPICWTKCFYSCNVALSQ